MSGARDDARPRRVAVAAVCDIANYGDQLFPLIAAHRLAPLGIAVEAVAPGAAHRLRPGALTPRSLDWLLAGGEMLDGVLIGGGNIVYNLRADYLARSGARDSWLGQGLHTGLWLGAALAAAIRDIPFGFNAPGLPYPFSGATARDVLRPVLQAADCCAFRDAASARLAEAAGVAVQQVPDTAIEIARMWPRDGLAPAAEAEGQPYAALHLRLAGEPEAHLAAVAALLDGFCTGQGLRPLLIAIGDDLGDGAAARRLAAAMTVPARVLGGDRSLQAVAAAIAGARIYLGGSLHGYVTAAAYGVPGLVVTAQPLRKFAGFLDWMERPADLATDWAAACARAVPLLAGGRVVVPDRIWQALDAHWAAVAAMLEAPQRRRAERAAMLRALTLRAVSRQGGGGLEWLMAGWHPPSARARTA
ncbi:polysaccharide pyruvyl transferase family protein [Teichococcus deserti]|nr:polysaccharide pyruvyl transferase family protein [Pseudoroseomonas deserti]